MADKQLQKKSDFPAMLEKFKGEIIKALPKHLSGDRMTRIALTAFRKNPKLGQCDPRSVFAAVIQASQLGLEPDTLGRSYLVPYKKHKKPANDPYWFECQFIPGWKGLIDLLNNTKQGTAWTGAVFEGDKFLYALGDRPYCTHEPMGEDDPAKLTHVYAIGRVNGAEWPIIEVWPMVRVWKHRDKHNKVGDAHYSFKNPEMYARKVVLLQVLKYMPSSPELATAIALNDTAETGTQNLGVKDAIEGSWTPVYDDGDAPTDSGNDIPMPESKSEQSKQQAADKKSGNKSGNKSANKQQPKQEQQPKADPAQQKRIEKAHPQHAKLYADLVKQIIGGDAESIDAAIDVARSAEFPQELMDELSTLASKQPSMQEDDGDLDDFFPPEEDGEGE